jgi:hypothetical protein
MIIQFGSFQMKTRIRYLAVLLPCIWLAACASNPGKTSVSEATAEEAPEGEIVGKPAPGSKFSRLRLGLTHQEVEALIGKADDVDSHQTGKSWIPFYYGKDAFHIVTYYKGEGRLTFSGSLFGNIQGTLITITVDTAEDGRK